MRARWDYPFRGELLFNARIASVKSVRMASLFFLHLSRCFTLFSSTVAPFFIKRVAALRLPAPIARESGVVFAVFWLSKGIGVRNQKLLEESSGDFSTFILMSGCSQSNWMSSS